MKASDLKEESGEQLQQRLSELFKEQFNLRMQKASGQLTRTHSLKEARRNIARVKTVLNERRSD